MQKIKFISALLTTVLLSLISCTSISDLTVENSLSKEKLAYYCDSFDTFREDIWEDALQDFIDQIEHGGKSKRAFLR